MGRGRIVFSVTHCMFCFQRVARGVPRCAREHSILSTADSYQSAIGDVRCTSDGSVVVLCGQPGCVTVVRCCVYTAHSRAHNASAPCWWQASTLTVSPCAQRIRLVVCTRAADTSNEVRPARTHMHPRTRLSWAHMGALVATHADPYPHTGAFPGGPVVRGTGVTTAPRTWIQRTCRSTKSRAPSSPARLATSALLTGGEVRLRAAMTTPRA